MSSKYGRFWWDKLRFIRFLSVFFFFLLFISKYVLYCNPRRWREIRSFIIRLFSHIFPLNNVATTTWIFTKMFLHHSIQFFATTFDDQCLLLFFIWIWHDVFEAKVNKTQTCNTVTLNYLMDSQMRFQPWWKPIKKDFTADVKKE